MFQVSSHFIHFFPSMISPMVSPMAWFQHQGHCHWRALFRLHRSSRVRLTGSSGVAANGWKKMACPRSTTYGYYDDIMLLLNDTVVPIYSYYMIVSVYPVLLRWLLWCMYYLLSYYVLMIGQCWRCFWRCFVVIKCSLGWLEMRRLYPGWFGDSHVSHVLWKHQ